MLEPEFSYHDNKVEFQSKVEGAPITSGSITINSYFVTGGQDPSGNVHDNEVFNAGGDGVFTFRLGRKGSSDTADWFKNQINSNQNTFGDNPGKLNFAFLVSLTITIGAGDFAGVYVFDNIMIAQGHTGTSNNWWFGGKNASKTSGENTVSCDGSTSDGSKAAVMHFNRGGAPWKQDPNQVFIKQIEVTG